MRESGVRWWQLPRVTRRARVLMRDEAGAIGKFPGVDDALAVLRRKGVGLALVTSNSEDNVRRILGERTAAHFDHVACGAPLLGKARKLRSVLKASGVPRERVLCIGDEIRDADVARALGLPFRGVAWGYTLPDALQAHSAQPLFNTPAEWALL
jgi:phosphoglycolate phosphatase